MLEIDQVQLNFSPDSLFVLNLSLGLIMFGVALELSISDFKRLLSAPRPVFAGVFAQFLMLPALTFLLVYAMEPAPSMALGMILVAACPGGNVSNFMSLLAKGNAALSVSLTAMATLLAIFMTPFNFAFWGSLYGPTQSLLQEVSLNPFQLLRTVAILLGVPLVLGMVFSHYFPSLTQRILKPLRFLSILIFAAIVGIAFANNFDFFLLYIHLIFFLVLIHNAIALGSGYLWARLLGLSEANCRALSIETGIQNSGLGLILIFNFFDGLGGMAIVAAWWGIWHIIAGLGVASFWRRRPLMAPSTT
jgi:BASS family bile acid:Na+ symporter